MANDIAWAQPSSTTSSTTATLAAQLRTKPFFEKWGIDFNTGFAATYAAVELRNLFIAGNIREGQIVAITKKRFPKGEVEIKTNLETGSLKRGKKYALATFDFKNEGKQIKVLLLRDYIDLNSQDLEELKKFEIKSETDVDHLSYPGLEGIWFINPVSAQQQSDAMFQSDLSSNLNSTEVAQQETELSPDKESNSDGYIMQGDRAIAKFEKHMMTSATDTYKDRVIGLLKQLLESGIALSDAERYRIEDVMDRIGGEHGQISTFESLIEGPDDFVLGEYGNYPYHLHIAKDLLTELDTRGPPKARLGDEYIIHELICRRVFGHYRAILFQQELFSGRYEGFPDHYLDKDKLKTQDRLNPYKGELGLAIRSSIDSKHKRKNIIKPVFKEMTEYHFREPTEIIKKTTAQQIAVIERLNEGVVGDITVPKDEVGVGLYYTNELSRENVHGIIATHKAEFEPLAGIIWKPVEIVVGTLLYKVDPLTGTIRIIRMKVHPDYKDCGIEAAFIGHLDDLYSKDYVEITADIYEHFDGLIRTMRDCGFKGKGIETRQNNSYIQMACKIPNSTAAEASEFRLPAAYSSPEEILKNEIRELQDRFYVQISESNERIEAVATLRSHMLYSIGVRKTLEKYLQAKGILDNFVPVIRGSYALGIAHPHSDLEMYLLPAANHSRPVEEEKALHKALSEVGISWDDVQGDGTFGVLFHNVDWYRPDYWTALKNQVLLHSRPLLTLDSNHALMLALKQRFDHQRQILGDKDILAVYVNDCIKTLKGSPVSTDSNNLKRERDEYLNSQTDYPLKALATAKMLFDALAFLAVMKEGPDAVVSTLPVGDNEQPFIDILNKVRGLKVKDDEITSDDIRQYIALRALLIRMHDKDFYRNVQFDETFISRLNFLNEFVTKINNMMENELKGEKTTKLLTLRNTIQKSVTIHFSPNPMDGNILTITASRRKSSLPYSLVIKQEGNIRKNTRMAGGERFMGGKSLTGEYYHDRFVTAIKEPANAENLVDKILDEYRRINPNDTGNLHAFRAWILGLPEIIKDDTQNRVGDIRFSGTMDRVEDIVNPSNVTFFHEVPLKDVPSRMFVYRRNRFDPIRLRIEMRFDTAGGPLHGKMVMEAITDMFTEDELGQIYLFAGPIFEDFSNIVSGNVNNEPPTSLTKEHHVLLMFFRPVIKMMVEGDDFSSLTYVTLRDFDQSELKSAIIRFEGLHSEKQVGSIYSKAADRRSAVKVRIPANALVTATLYSRDYYEDMIGATLNDIGDKIEKLPDDHPAKTDLTARFRAAEEKFEKLMPDEQYRTVVYPKWIEDLNEWQKLKDEIDQIFETAKLSGQSNYYSQLIKGYPHRAQDIDRLGHSPEVSNILAGWVLGKIDEAAAINAITKLLGEHDTGRAMALLTQLRNSGPLNMAKEPQKPAASPPTKEPQAGQASGAAGKPSRDANALIDSVYRECKAIESTFFKHFRKKFPDDSGSCKAASFMLSRILSKRLDLPTDEISGPAPNRIALEPGLIRPYVDAGKEAEHLWVVVYINNKPALYIDATTGQLKKGKFNTIYVGNYEKSIAFFDLLPPEAAMEYVIARDLKRHRNVNGAELRRDIQRIRSEAPYLYIVPERYKKFESPRQALNFNYIRFHRLQLCTFYEDDASRGEVAELYNMVARIIHDIRTDSDKHAMEIESKKSPASGGAAANQAATEVSPSSNLGQATDTPNTLEYSADLTRFDRMFESVIARCPELADKARIIRDRCKALAPAKLHFALEIFPPTAIAFQLTEMYLEHHCAEQFVTYTLDGIDFNLEAATIVYAHASRISKTDIIVFNTGAKKDTIDTNISSDDIAKLNAAVELIRTVSPRDYEAILRYTKMIEVSPEMDPNIGGHVQLPGWTYFNPKFTIELLAVALVHENSHNKYKTDMPSYGFVNDMYYIVPEGHRCEAVHGEHRVSPYFAELYGYLDSIEFLDLILSQSAYAPIHLEGLLKSRKTQLSLVGALFKSFDFIVNQGVITPKGIADIAECRKRYEICNAAVLPIPDSSFILESITKGEPSNGERRSSSLSSTSFGLAQTESDKVHAENLKYTPAIPEKTILCHIITDSILPDGQRNILNLLEKDMRDKTYTEKVACLSNANPVEFTKEVEAIMARQRELYRDCIVEFDIACPNTDLVSAVLNSGLGIKALAFERCKEPAQVEGIILALRALHTDNLEKLMAIIGILAVDHPEKLAGIKTIEDFVKQITFILPTAKELNYEETRRLNDIIRENIKTAA